MRVPIGPLADIPADQCTAVADGIAVALRVGDTAVVFRNRCLHQDSPLAGGIVRDGVLSCPLHFWRYRADDGRMIGTRRELERFPVEVVDGDVFVELPDPAPARSLRDQLLTRAREYDRDVAWGAEQAAARDHRTG